MKIALIGTLDTKGTELEFVRHLIAASGLPTITIDAGVLGSPTCSADIGREEVFSAAGASLREVASRGERGGAVNLAAVGVKAIVQKLHARGEVRGIFGLGGSAGTTIATAAMQALPYGIPKVMVSTLASGQVRPFVGVRDIHMVHSVTDISGLNRFTRQILANAANALVGMVMAPPLSKSTDRPMIGATMFGVTTPCVQASQALLEAKGYEVLVFHATGSGGQTMEAMTNDGLFSGILDITTTELADELVGGVLSAGKDRLTAASLRGVPQVISVGALDMVNFGPADTIPKQFEGRRFHRHNANVTLMRTTPEENDRLGKEIVEKACASRGPVAILLPLKGVSAIDRDGGPFWWPTADAALFQSIRNWSAPPLKVIELNCHINDPEFSKAAVETLMAMIALRVVT